MSIKRYNITNTTKKLSSGLGELSDAGRNKGFTIVELLIIIVVIAILAAITIVSYNGIQNQAREAVKASDISSWKKQSELHKIRNGIECPANFVFVYGNANLGTDDFCVAKYETKIQGNDDGSQPYVATLAPEVRASGTPWVNISQTNAIAESQTLCAGCHLITEAEWMTLAADVLSVKYNWSTNKVGEGYIYRGHSDNFPANSLIASTNDNDGYFGTGNTAGSDGNDQRRTLYLKSGDVIWDMTGNAREWTQGTMTGAQPGPAGQSSSWREYPIISSWGNLSELSRPSALASIHDLEGVNSWNASNNGIGQIHSNPSQTAQRAFLRGGDWGNGSNAGVLSLGLSAASANTSAIIGFRIAR